MKVFSITIVQSDAGVCFQRLSEVSFELRPSANGVQPPVGVLPGGGVDAKQNVFIDPAAQAAESPATITFPADLKPGAERNSPIRRSRPGVHTLIAGVALPAVVSAKPYLEGVLAREGPVGHV